MSRVSRLGEFWLVLFIGIGLLTGAVIGLVAGLAFGLSLTRWWVFVLTGMGVGLVLGLIRNATQAGDRAS